MLVLSRRVGEKIVIGDSIVIEVLSVTSEGARLGITAPRSTTIHRHEVFAEIEAAKHAAARAVVEIDAAALDALTANVKLESEIKNEKV